MLDAAKLRAGAQRYKRKTREVHVPGLADGDDDVVLVRGLSALEYDAHQAATRVMGENGEQIGIDESNVSARLAVRVIVDPEGNRVLQDTDASWLGEASPKDVAEILNVALELSGVTADGQVSEETVKDSAPTPVGETSSERPEPTEQPQPSLSGV